jgi:hypothetical protein
MIDDYTFEIIQAEKRANDVAKVVEAVCKEMLSDELHYKVTVLDDSFSARPTKAIEIHLWHGNLNTIVNLTVEEIERSNYDIIRYHLKRIAAELGHMLFLKKL